jgi:pimeloyl-ACP methyl ester carboxylesterase
MPFQERFIEADGFRIRCLEAGDGPVLVHLHGAGGLRLHRAHEMLAQHHRVIVMEMPGFGHSPENTRSATTRDLSATMAAAIAALGIDTFDLMGTSYGGKVVLWLAADHPERVRALVLEAPAAIRPVNARPSSGTPAERAARIYAHPERMPPPEPLDDAIQAKQLALVMRSIGPARDPELEARMRTLQTPVLVLFGTMDRIIPSEMGRHYKTLLPHCHLIFVYDAGHAPGAERPEAFTEAVTDFLARQEAFVVTQRQTMIFP